MGITIEKTKNGKYRARRMVDGKRVVATFDHKPTQREAELELNERIQKKQRSKGRDNLTFGDAAEMYLNAKSNVLSPTTIRGYRNIIKGLSGRFRGIRIDNMMELDVQEEINDIAARLSAKTVKNYHGFISSVLALYRPDMALKTKLPILIPKDAYIPTIDELNAIMREAEGTPFFTAIYMAALGMRRSEICALQMSDIDFDNNVIHINKAKVQNSNEEWIIKSYTKTAKSTRNITVPADLIASVRRNGLYQGYPGNITNWMLKAERRLGINHFSVHKLRHAFFSYGIESGVSRVMLRYYGGMSTDYTMNRVYTHPTKDSKSVSDIMEHAYFG